MYPGSKGLSTLKWSGDTPTGCRNFLLELDPPGAHVSFLTHGSVTEQQKTAIAQLSVGHELVLAA